MDARRCLLDAPAPAASSLSQQRRWLMVALLGLAGVLINANWSLPTGGVALALGGFAAYFAVRIFSPVQMALAAAVSAAGGLARFIHRTRSGELAGVA